jgi:kynureninase
MDFHPDEAFARQMDHDDPLSRFRDAFHISRRPDGSPAVYFCGHSLGLQPKGVRALIDEELEDWARLGVEAHFKDRTPWYSYHELLREPAARLVGARPGEVVIMNSLTINLHLMMVAFYHPAGGRSRVLMDEPVFPSDRYAVASHLRHRGVNPKEGLLTLQPRSGEYHIRMEDVEEVLERRGREIGLVLWSGVNFFTGQLFPLDRLTSVAHRHGCIVGLDLAHAAGNVELQLHDWQVDFAVWCSYKYLNSGPGAVAGCFVHEKHGRNPELPRFAGWWGNDPATRFRMHLQPDFIPFPGAEGWQVSNPPIFSMVPLRSALALFDEATMPALRRRSQRLTGYLDYLLRRLPPGNCEVITPGDLEQRGCQLSLLVRERPHELLKALEAEGVVCDFREPNVVRVAPVPLYNTFHEVWRFAQVLARQR